MSDKAHLKKRAEALLGRVLRDKWQLDALVGVGGMGAVFAATHKNNGSRAAIKILHPELGMDEELRARFLREGYVANKVGHAGVCAVLDDDVSEDGLVYLVLELLEGETLRARWLRAKKKLPAGEVLTIADRILDVLAAAHEKGIVHRDMKPENVFVGPSVSGVRDATPIGEVKVLDFGIARLREMSSEMQPTRSGAQMGTPAFMAPEQARAKWDAIDGRADLWALGATMFTLLTGEYVHPRETGAELLISAATEPARSLRTVMPDVDPRLADVVDRALIFDPSGRWQNARAMQDAIVALRSQPDPDVEPPTLGRRSDLGPAGARRATPDELSVARPRQVETRPLSMPLLGKQSSPPPAPRPSSPPARTIELPAPTVRDAELASAIAAARPPSNAPPPDGSRLPSNAPLAASLPPPSARRAGTVAGIVLGLAALVAVAWGLLMFFGAGAGARSTHVSGSSIARPASAARETPPAATVSAKVAAPAKPPVVSARPEPPPPPPLLPRRHRQPQGLAP